MKEKLAKIAVVVLLVAMLVMWLRYRISEWFEDLGWTDPGSHNQVAATMLHVAQIVALIAIVVIAVSILTGWWMIALLAIGVLITVGIIIDMIKKKKNLDDVVPPGAKY